LPKYFHEEMSSVLATLGFRQNYPAELGQPQVVIHFAAMEQTCVGSDAVRAFLTP